MKVVSQKTMKASKIFFFVLATVLIISPIAMAAVQQTVDGRVFYNNGTDLISVGNGIPVLWYYEDHDEYSYTTTTNFYSFRWNSTSYYGFPSFQGNNSQ